MYLKSKLLLAFIFIVFYSCNKKEDDNQVIVYTQDQVNDYDIKSLELILDNYYFDSVGNIKKITDDKTQQKLRNFATKLESGVWIVRNPKSTSNGTKIDTSKKLTIYYNNLYFLSSADSNTNVQVPNLSSDSNFSNILFGNGKPTVDPTFIYAPLYNSGDVKSDYEIEGIIEGLKNFEVSNDSEGLYNLQGAILVPSKLAYDRSLHYVGIVKSNAYSDYCFVFNFQVKKMEDR